MERNRSGNWWKVDVETELRFHWKIDLFVFRTGAREGRKSWFLYTNRWLELKTRFFDSKPFWLPFWGLKGSRLAPFSDKMCPKWTSKPCSENVQVLTHVLIDFGSIFNSKMDSFFAVLGSRLAPKSHAGPHLGPAGVVLWFLCRTGVHFGGFWDHLKGRDRDLEPHLRLFVLVFST